LRQLGKIAIARAIDFAIQQLGAITDRGIGTLIGGRSPMTFEGIGLTSSSPSLWAFTGPENSVDRPFETVSTLPNNEVTRPVALTASIGSVESCRAQTAFATPEAGENGFVITASSTVRLATTQSALTLEAGRQSSITLDIVNEGVSPSGALRYEITSPYNAPFGGLSINAPSGPSQLTGGQTGRVLLGVRARADAPPRLHTFRVVAFEDDEEISSSLIEITVESQLSDLVVNNESGSLTMVDFGSQDGDIVNITLNGSAVATGHTLLNAGTTFPLSYVPGPNVVSITAVNEGRLSPNTARLEFSDVVSGASVQEYGLTTGQKVQVVVFYDPNAVAAAKARPVMLLQPACDAAPNMQDCTPAR
jgi:hypothetical protein